MIRYPYVISLPNINIHLTQNDFSGEYLLVAGGRTPSPAWLKAASMNRRLYAVDHGADACRAAGLVPELFIGDGDSAKRDTLSWIEDSHVACKRFPPEKDKTDTQLALETVDENRNPFVIIAGGFGGRFDHAFSLLYSFVGTGLHGCLADDHEFLFVLREDDEIVLEISSTPKSLSLLPLTPECQGVSIDGVHWPLSDAVLRQDNPYAISNRLAPSANRITARNRTGVLGLYLCWDESMK